jgi:hypothetical protein
MHILVFVYLSNLIVCLSVVGALRQVSQAAAHANDSMKRIEQFKKLLEVQDSIGGAIDLVSPTRQTVIIAFSMSDQSCGTVNVTPANGLYAT